MTREQAINSMISHGFTVEQAGEIIKAVTLQEPSATNCESCRYYGSHHEVCNYCYKCSLWTEQEPTTKNDLEVDCISRAEARKAIIDHQYSNGFCEEHNIDHSINTSVALLVLSDMPSVTPQLSVPEVTALAEWTEKLTKASEDAYNKGYVDGMKEQDPTIKALGKELRKARKGIADEKVLIGYNMAVAICNKYLGETEE